MSAPIRLVLADDHPIVLQGLEQLFRREPDLTVLATATDGDAALESVRQHQPDVLVLDLRLPAKDGIEVLRLIKRAAVRTHVVLLTAAIDEEQLLEAVRLGAAGVVMKDAAPNVLVRCIRRVHAGGRWLDMDSLIGSLDRGIKRESAARELGAVLTPREIEIVRLVAGGLRNKEIAGRLHVSEGTVKIHLHNVYGKLKIDGRVALVLYARDKGLT